MTPGYFSGPARTASFDVEISESAPTISVGSETLGPISVEVDFKNREFHTMTVIGTYQSDPDSFSYVRQEYQDLNSIPEWLMPLTDINTVIKVVYGG